MYIVRVITPYILLALGLLAGYIYGNTHGYARGLNSVAKISIEGCADTPLVETTLIK